MGIEAAELIGRPLGQGVMDSGINPQQYLLAVIHGSGVESASELRSGILVPADAGAESGGVHANGLQLDSKTEFLMSSWL